jgi:hypothetical protein
MPAHLLRTMLALCASFVLLWSAPGAAQSKAAEFEAALAREFRGFVESEKALDGMIRSMYPQGVSLAKHMVLRTQLRKAFAHPKLAKVAAESLTALVPTNPDRVTVATAMLQTMSHLQAKGMMRLSDEDLLLFFRHTAGIMKSLPAVGCRDLALERISDIEAREVEQAFLARASDDYFRDITEFYVRATLAELDGFPHVRHVTVEQVQLAQRVYATELKQRVRRSPDVLPARNTPASARQECQYALLALQTLFDMPEPYRSWQLTSAVSAIAR